MDIETMKQLIKKYEPGHAAFVTRAAVAERYYRNETDILFRDKPKDKGKEESDNPLRNADNRIPRNFHGLIVNQKASYAFTAPPLFDVGNTAANKHITKALGDEYAKNCMDRKRDRGTRDHCGCRKRKTCFIRQGSSKRGRSRRT